jgi:hypothetical protein
MLLDSAAAGEDPDRVMTSITMRVAAEVRFRREYRRTL